MEGPDEHVHVRLPQRACAVPVQQQPRRGCACHAEEQRKGINFKIKFVQVPTLLESNRGDEYHTLFKLGFIKYLPTLKNG